MFIHPKTGDLGGSNITNESKAYLYKKVIECIENKDLFLLELDSNTGKIVFKSVRQS